MLTAALFLIAGLAHAAADTSTHTATATETATATDTRTATSTASATATATTTSTATSTRTATVTRTATSTRTSSITMTFTRTFTPTLTFTPTRTHTRTSTPSFTVTNTGTPSGQRIKQQQVEGFLTPVAPLVPAATVTDLLSLERMFSYQFALLAHPHATSGPSNAWYDDPTQYITTTFFIYDSGEFVVGTAFAVVHWPVSIRPLAMDFTAAAPSTGGGTEVFRLTDGVTNIDITAGNVINAQATYSGLSLQADPTLSFLKVNASTVGASSARVTLAMTYVRN